MAENTKKSLVEEALLQMKNLEEAVTENAKGILASTMKEEISELVKESLSEEEADEMVNTEVEMEATEEVAEEVTEQEVDMEDEEEVEMEPEMGDMDADEDSEMEDEDMGDEIDMEDMLMLDLPGDELEVDDEEEVLLPLDLTGASDEEILKVFKAMGDEDGIIVKQDGDEIHLSDEEEDVEYIIQTESEEDKMTEVDEGEENTDPFADASVEEMDEEVVFEIEMDVEEEDEEKSEMVDEGYDESNEEYKEETTEEWNEEVKEGGAKKGDQSKTRSDYKNFKDTDPNYHGKDGESHGDQSSSKGDYTEAARTLGNGDRNYPKRKGLPKMKVKPNKSVNESELKAEVDSLRAKNEEYRKALNIFREKLNEVAVFNSNLAYATRLFTEHSTTKQEKINILRRFDSVETLKESKTLYKTLKEDFDGKETVVKESVESKVQKSPSKGSATNLIESKTYENPQFLRMRDLMTKITK
jgi:hypothetical protein